MKKWTNNLGICSLGILLFLMMPVWAETRLELEETTVTGARELPKVLYIVPWRKSWPGLRPLTIKSQLQEPMEALDIDEFRRQLRYDDMTHAGQK